MKSDMFGYPMDIQFINILNVKFLETERKYNLSLY